MCLDNMSSPWLLISNLRLTSALYLVIKPLIRSQILKFNQVRKVLFLKKDKLKWNQINQAEIQLFQRETLAFLTLAFLYFYAEIFDLTVDLVKCPFLSHLLCFAQLSGCKNFQSFSTLVGDRVSLTAIGQSRPREQPHELERNKLIRHSKLYWIFFSSLPQ